jgi:hypothetical protein
VSYSIALANICDADFYADRRAVADVVDRVDSKLREGALGDGEALRDAGQAIIASAKLLERLQRFHPEYDPNRGGMD